MVGDTVTFSANVGDPSAAKACIDFVVRELGSVDILVNNAASNPYIGPIIDIDLSSFDKMVQTNLRGPLVWTQLGYHASMSQ
jgi:NAD(P)-dependent dehydrogenase (short-subunit alcohol dehydrogenase family)